MEFITTGNRIAVENFDIGKIYTITWQTGNYKSLACTGKGTDFVMFQDQEPDLLFCLTMDSAISVASIDEGGGGSGTSNYNALDNKPQINGVTLIGNKSSSDLNIYDVPAVTSENNNHILTASFSGGVGSYSWQPAQGGGGTSDYTQLSNLPQINSVELLGNKSLSDLGIASTEALAGYQPLINDLSTIRSGAAAGATAVQPATLSGYQTLIDSSHKLSSDLVEDTGHTNKFATAAQLAQIETNKNNILTLESKNGSKNYLNYDKTILQSLNTGGSWADNVWTIGNGVTLTVNADNSITLNGTSTAGKTIYLARNLNLPSDVYILSMTTALITKLWAGISAVGGGEYNFTSPNSYISQSCQANTITIYIDNGCVLNNITLYPMLCDDESWAVSHTYQPYAMSNAEITAWIKAHT